MAQTEQGQGHSETISALLLGRDLNVISASIGKLGAIERERRTKGCHLTRCCHLLLILWQVERHQPAKRNLTVSTSDDTDPQTPTGLLSQFYLIYNLLLSFLLVYCMKLTGW